MNPMEQFGSIFAMLKNGMNPQALLNMMVGSNPAFKAAISATQGKSPTEIEQFVRDEFKNRGMDINQVMSQFGLR